MSECVYIYIYIYIYIYYTNINMYCVLIQLLDFLLLLDPVIGIVAGSVCVCVCVIWPLF